MITYNQERFVRQAIQSVFIQQVSFPIELVIGEDFSTDGTVSEIESTCNHAPLSVRLIRSHGNVGMHANFKRTLQACRGKYVALVEGDDYWTDANKLARQFEILEREAGIVLCFHRAQILCEPDKQDRFGPPGTPQPRLPSGEIALETILSFDFLLPTASVVLRRSAVLELPIWTESLQFLDWAIWSIAALQGRVILLDEVMSVYRYGYGISSEFDWVTNSQHQLRLIRELLRHTSHHPVDVAVLGRALVDRMFATADMLEDAGRQRECQVLLCGVALGRFTALRERRRAIVWAFRITFPRLHHILHAALRR